MTITAGNATKPTPVNITNHSYFNLDGHGHPSGVHEHQLQIMAGAYTPLDSESCPTKEVVKFESNEDVNSFMQPKILKTAIFEKAKSEGYSQEELDQILELTGKSKTEGLGFDHNCVVDNFDGSVRHIATLTGSSGRIMEVSSDQPGV